MAQRGLQAYKEWKWEREQYAAGVSDGLNGRQGMYSDMHYQKGFRRGRERREKGLKTVKIMRTDLTKLKARAKRVSSHQDITTSTAHAFMVREADKEAHEKGGTVRVVGGRLSGRSTATVVVNGQDVAIYTQDWPSRQMA